MNLLTGDRIAWLLGVVALAAAAVRLWRWWLPRWKAMRADFVAIRDTLLGRDAIRDTITREVRMPELPSIGVQMAETKAQLEFAIGKLHEIEHEVKNNDGSSMKDSVGRVERRLRDGDTRFAEMAAELATLRTMLGTLAEAQPQLWSAIEAVAKSTPPEDLGLEQPDLA